MKSIHKIKYQQRNRWLSLPFGLNSALHFLKQYNLSKAISKLSYRIEKEDIITQCEVIVHTYNLTFDKSKNYGLGKEIVVTKQKKLTDIQKNLHVPNKKLITIIVGNHSVTLVNIFIFDSLKKWALYRSKETLKHIFEKDYKINRAIQYSHNAASI